ncbi:MAG TPA: sulfate adenylyltransferase subunit CysN [Thermoanaerobaculia bacterium]
MTAPSGEARGVEQYLERYESRDLLRFLTCGSVDDGKSTLIGRLLHDSQMVYDDLLAAARRDTIRHGTTEDEIDFALLVDGLEAEREQGITIDVAYRYFSTPKRIFIIADTPGHEQYTRNMATGASNSDLAIILVDARKGLLDQTRRHAFIASLLGIRHLVVAVNKMDLLGYAEERFEEIRSRFADFAAKLQVTDVDFIPMSALRGENVVRSGESMPWYQGPPLLSFLETVHIAGDRNLIDLRFPVQMVLRPDLDYRGYAGSVASGILRTGDEVMVLPSMRTSRIRRITTFDGDVGEAFSPMAVTVMLEGESDVSRGDMLVHPNNVPQLTREFEAMLVWMAEEPLAIGREYLLKQTTVQVPAIVSDLRYRMNVGTISREQADSLALNEIGRVRVETPRALAIDPYARNKATGAFILIDRLSNVTVAAGMILDREPAESLSARPIAIDAGSNVRTSPGRGIAPAERSTKLGQQPVVVWLTGLPRSGKSSIAYALEGELFKRGKLVAVLDGESLRLGISRDLGFSPRDRAEHVRRAAEIAKMMADLGSIVLAAFVSPTEAERRVAREIIGAGRFVEVYCNAPLEVCEQRDQANLFARARQGEIHNVTGIDAPYEPPLAPDLEIRTAERSVEEAVTEVLRLIL